MCICVFQTNVMQMYMEMMPTEEWMPGSDESEESGEDESHEDISRESGENMDHVVDERRRRRSIRSLLRKKRSVPMPERVPGMEPTYTETEVDSTGTIHLGDGIEITSEGRFRRHDGTEVEVGATNLPDGKIFYISVVFMFKLNINFSNDIGRQSNIF